MSSWIFQGRPATFRVDDAIRDLDRITWAVRKYHARMRPGDTVFIWKSKYKNEPAGIVAKTIMDGSWRPMFSPPEVFCYWIDPEVKNIREDRVWLKIIERESEVHTMITRDRCLRDDILKEMLVIRQPTGTNYPLSDNEAEILELIWAGT